MFYRLLLVLLWQPLSLRSNGQAVFRALVFEAEKCRNAEPLPCRNVV